MVLLVSPRRSLAHLGVHQAGQLAVRDVIQVLDRVVLALPGAVFVHGGPHIALEDGQLQGGQDPVLVVVLSA